jgi:hypothetical protein
MKLTECKVGCPRRGRKKIVELPQTGKQQRKGEICRCGSKKDWEHIRNFVGWCNFNFCPECGGKLSPVA